MYKGKEYNDLWVILQNMSRYQTEMIPDKYMEFVRDSMVESYESDIDPEIPLEEQVLSEKTKSLLASLYVTYWAEGESSRREFCEKLFRNEQAASGKEPVPMTEEDYQDFLKVFDDWNEMFGMIPFWAQSRKWQPRYCHEVVSEAGDDDIVAGDLCLRIVYMPPEQRRIVLEEAKEWVLVADVTGKEELYWHDDDTSTWTYTREIEDYYENAVVVKDGHFYGALVHARNRWGMGLASYRDDGYGVLCIDGTSHGNTEDYESRSSDESSHSEETVYSLRRRQTDIN